MARRLALSLCVLIGTAAYAAPAGAERAAGVTSTNTLVLFDTATPGTVTPRPITGLLSADEISLGIDFRPATGELFLVTARDNLLGAASVTRTYSVDPATGAATFVGAIQDPPPANAGDAPSGLDFQPLVDRIRLVNTINENLRINPATGALAGNDPDLTFTAPATGPVTGLAYDRNVAPGPPGTLAPPGARTTLYGIDAGSDHLVVQGGIDGSTPGGPNGGTVSSIGPLGVTMTSGVDAGFDISPAGTAYASLAANSGAPRSLYTVNLQTGTATLIGSMPFPVIGISVFPPDNCPGVSGDNQADLDGDGLGDACDPDMDGDGVSNEAEAARGTNPASADSDGDGVPDGPDACPTVAGAAPTGCPLGVVDRTRPRVTLSRFPRRVTRKRLLGGITGRIRVNEPASLEVALLGRAGSAGLARVGDLVLAETSFRRSARTRSVRLKPRRRLVRGARRFNVRLRVIATDAAGNRSTSFRTIRVRG